MPWSENDGPARHTKKANTPAKKRQWAAAANSVLADSGDEGKAVRIANNAVARHPSIAKINGRI
jgi:uncharacterized protein YdaT